MNGALDAIYPLVNIRLGASIVKTRLATSTHPTRGSSITPPAAGARARRESHRPDSGRGAVAHAQEQCDHWARLGALDAPEENLGKAR